MDDDEEYNPEEVEPGTTQIQLLHDLVFDPTLPLKAPRPVKKAPGTNAKRNSFPPGYDPDTMDLFADLVVPDQCDPDEPPGQALPAEPAPCTLSLQLRSEITSELNAILADMKDQPPV